MVPNVNGDVSIGKRNEHLVIQISEITKQSREFTTVIVEKK